MSNNLSRESLVDIRDRLEGTLGLLINARAESKLDEILSGLEGRIAELIHNMDSKGIKTEQIVVGLASVRRVLETAKDGFDDFGWKILGDIEELVDNVEDNINELER